MVPGTAMPDGAFPTLPPWWPTPTALLSQLTSPQLSLTVLTTCLPTVCPSLPPVSTLPDSDSPDSCPTPTVPLSPLSPKMLLLPARSTWLPTPRLKKLSKMQPQEKPSSVPHPNGALVP